jgi:hypothetical protein
VVDYVTARWQEHFIVSGVEKYDSLDFFRYATFCVHALVVHSSLVRYGAVVLGNETPTDLCYVVIRLSDTSVEDVHC